MTNLIIPIALSIATLGSFILAIYEYRAKKSTERQLSESVEVFKKTLSDLEDRRQSDITIMTESNLSNIRDYESKIEGLKVKSIADVDAVIAEHNEELEELRDLHIKLLETVTKDYAKTVDDQNEALAAYEKHLVNLDTTISFTSKLIKDLDVKGTFSSDDEIGAFFKAVKEMQGYLDKFKLENKEEQK